MKGYDRRFSEDYFADRKADPNLELLPYISVIAITAIILLLL
ncbi:MAG TPA: hypothetical protein VJI75_01305 [Candidatus Nanoarchaeia archaeon]|nr:hypothetical protein [Candidatus Nanoarchaeia archaeon]